jgi:hypothetical protein
MARLVTAVPPFRRHLGPITEPAARQWRGLQGRVLARRRAGYAEGAQPAISRLERREGTLPFTLLSDQGGHIRKRYGVPAVLGLIPGRVTYVIDRQGVVRQVFSSMTNISQHVTDALEMVRQLQADQRA